MLLSFLCVGISFCCLAQVDINKIDSTAALLPDLIPYKVKSKFGYVNSNGNLVIKAKYDFAEPFGVNCLVLNNEDSTVRKYGTKDYATVKLRKQLYRIDKKGKIVCVYASELVKECVKTGLGYDPKLFIRFYDNEKMGLKTANGFYNGKFIGQETIILNANYELIKWPYRSNGFYNGPFLAKQNGKWGIVDYFDKVLIDFKYDAILFYDTFVLLLVMKGKTILCRLFREGI